MAKQTKLEKLRHRVSQNEISRIVYENCTADLEDPTEKELRRIAQSVLERKPLGRLELFGAVTRYRRRHGLSEAAVLDQIRESSSNPADE